MYWEACLPRGFRRPSEGDIAGCKKFIEDKYRCGFQATKYHLCPLSWQTSISTSLSASVWQKSHLPCRSRSYVDRKYSTPPSIEAAETHPFFSDIAAKVDGDIPESVSSASNEAAGRTASARNSSTATAVVAAPAQKSAAPKPSAPAAEAQPPAQLFDLLSLDAVRACCPTDTCARLKWTASMSTLCVHLAVSLLYASLPHRALQG